jgi:hypothetical protein
MKTFLQRSVGGIVFVGLLMGALSVPSAEYGWSAPMEPTAPDTNRQPRAYLWIPPNCHRVCAVVLGQHNMIEEGILELDDHPTRIHRH